MSQPRQMLFYLMPSISFRSFVAKFFTDFFPLIVFFISFKLRINFYIFSADQPIIFATFALMLATIFAIVLSLILKIQITPVTLYSGILIIVFGLLTVCFHNATFIKIKVTIINLLFAATLAAAAIRRKPVTKTIFAKSMTFTMSQWIKLDVIFACVFATVAIINESVWRNLSTEAWVFFKVFCVLPIMLVCFISAILVMSYVGKSATNRAGRSM